MTYKDADTKSWDCPHPKLGNYTDIRAELARVTAERDSMATAVHMLRADADKMRVELEALRAQQRGPLTGAEDAGIMQLIDEYANAVHDGADDRCAALRRTIEVSLTQAGAVMAERERWVALCKDFAADNNPPHKSYDGTYCDGWRDACNEIMWAGEKECPSATPSKTQPE